MNSQTKKIVIVTSLVLVCVVVGLQLGVGKQKTVMAAGVSSKVDIEQERAVAEPVSVNHNSFADVEARREQALEEKRAADELAKLQNKKAKSVECVFWKQQKHLSSAANIDEKIQKFCNI